jgi:hemerythrin
MQTLEWHTQLSTGLEILDSEHQVMFGLISNCLELARTGASKQQLLTQLVEISKRLNEHFYIEECLTNGAGQVHTDIHKAQHDALLGDIKEKITSFEFDSDSRITAQGILVFLHDWLVIHITHEDRRLVSQTSASHAQTANPGLRH